MKLTNFRIQNFKSLYDVSFQPGRVNVFIGPNGAGKTSLLEALGVCSSALFHASDTMSNKTNQYRGIRLSIPKLYMSSFRQSGRQEFISFNLEWEDNIDGNIAASQYSFSTEFLAHASGFQIDQYLCKEDNATIIDMRQLRMTPPSQRKKQLFPPAYASVLEKNHFDYVLTDPFYIRKSNYWKITPYFSPYAIYQPVTPILRGTIPDPSQSEPLGLNGGRLAEAVEDLMRTDEEGNPLFGSLEMGELLDLIDWMEDFSITAPSRDLLNANVPTTRSVIAFRDRFLDENLRFTGYDASEGALYVLFLLTLAMHEKAPKVFAVDNFDQALNPVLAARLTETFCRLILEQEKQVFLTTHNPLVLDGLDLGNDDIRLFTVDRDSVSGQTVVRRVELSPDLMKKDQPLSRLWANGLLGGVPL